MKIVVGITCLALLVPLLCLACYCQAEESDQLQDVYKRIADGLINIRKEYPTSQPKVYAMLDQLDKLYTTAKSAEQKRQNLKEQLKVKVTENVALKAELAAIKTDVSTTKKALETANVELDQKLETEKLQVAELARERKNLLSKINELEGHKAIDQDKRKLTHLTKNELASFDEQKQVEEQKQAEAEQGHPSLRRISTSEPSSPR